MSRIAVDIDDSITDFNLLARHRMAEIAERTGDERLKTASYSTWDEWRTPSDLAGKDAWQEVIDYCHHPDQIMSREPFPGAKDALWSLYLEGHELVYVSNRSPETYEPTHTWLLSCDFPVTDLLCHTNDKLASISDCTYLIDDRPKTLVGFVRSPETSSHGSTPEFPFVRKAFGLVMPYNRNLTDIPRIFLAPSWPLLGRYLREKIPSAV